MDSEITVLEDLSARKTAVFSELTSVLRGNGHKFKHRFAVIGKIDGVRVDLSLRYDLDRTLNTVGNLLMAWDDEDGNRNQMHEPVDGFDFYVIAERISKIIEAQK